MGSHYYAKDGTPEHFRGPNGSPTTLREARKLGLCPSVSTVLDVLAKPGLERWKRNQSVLAALTLGRKPGEADEDFLRRIDADGSAQAREAAEHGTAIHAAVEAGMAGETVPARFAAHWAGTRQRLTELFPKVTDWVSEKRFCHPLGFGGTCDLHSPSTGIVVDFKTSEIAPDDTKRLAWEQHYQLAAYQRGLQLPRNVGANLFISRSHPGHVVSHVWEEPEMDHGWEVFTAALRIWQLVRKYDGGW